VISDIVSDLKTERKNYIDGHPIFSRLRSGDIHPVHYFAYLRETYHLIRHTPQYLTIAAGRAADGDRRLAEYFRAFAREEAGHELLCVRDLEALGQNVEAILSGHPSPGCWGMVTQCYYWAAQGNPVALLGDAFATEELGAASGLEIARRLETDYGIPRKATNFLRVHGSEDQHHFAAAARAIEWYADDAQQYAEIVYATKMTYRNYGQLFTDVLTTGDSANGRGVLTRLILVFFHIGLVLTCGS
jgi:pyrroloquinoline quinone (PQQ) biosynthesis protein C